MKTYMPMTENRDGIHYPEMYEAEGGEWVPAEVAQGLYDALEEVRAHMPVYAFKPIKQRIDKALAAADGEEV